MEESNENDIKDILLFHTETKVEPVKEEFTLNSEFVECSSSVSQTDAVPSVEYNNILLGRSTEENLFKLKELKVIVKDCMQDLTTLKSDVKIEPEEGIFGDFPGPQTTDDPSSYEAIPQLQPSQIKTERKINEEDSKYTKTTWINKLNKMELQEELKKFQLPSTGYVDGDRTIMRNLVRRNHSVSTSSTDSDNNDESYNPETKLRNSTSRTKKSAIVKKTKLNESKNQTVYARSQDNQLYEISTERINQFKEKSNKPKTAWITRLNKKELQEELKKFGLQSTGYIDDDRTIMRNFLKGNLSHTASTEHESTQISTSSGKSDNNDESYNPETDLRNSTSRTKKNATVNKRKLNETKNQTVHAGSLDNQEEEEGVLWSCCDMQFEQFSAYNEHKMQKHHIEELKCSFCTEQSFSSLDEIEKHYFDLHTDSIWTSFNCIDCRLVFGMESSYFEHKAKCSESRIICSEILDSIIDIATKNEKIKEITAFRLSCCENKFGKFEDFVAHKFSDHNIPLLTCGLCLCVKESEYQLKSHYRKFHFAKFWRSMDFERNDRVTNSSTLALSSTSSTELDECTRNNEVRAKPAECTALQDGILCQCGNCTILVDKTKSFTAKAVTDLDDIKKPFHCKMCHLRFRYKSRLDIHLRIHEGRKLYPCDICGSAYTSGKTLEYHKLSKHSTNALEHACNICNKVLSSKKTLEMHITRMHLKVKKNIVYKCEHCGKIQSTRHSHVRHVRYFHTKDKEFICDYCKKIHYDKTSLVYHIRRWHLPNKKYLQNHNLKSHGNKQFSCEICGKAFKKKIQLQYHVAVHSDEKKFVCQTCGKRFKQPMNLYQHTTYTHSDARPHVCNICGLTFKLRTHVKQHMAVHGLASNHQCYICDRSFARKTELNSHISAHGI